MQTEEYLLWSLRDVPGQQTLKAFQPHGPLPAASVKASVRRAEFPAPVAAAAAAAAAASAATACAPAAPKVSRVVQRIDFSQPGSQDELHIQQAGAEHVSAGQDKPEQHQQHSYMQAKPAVTSDYGTAGLSQRSVNGNDLQLAASLPHCENHRPLHEAQHGSQHRDSSVQHNEVSVQAPANAPACRSSSPHSVVRLGGCSVDDAPPSKKQCLDNAASAASAAGDRHPEQSAADKETSPETSHDVLQHGGQQECYAGTHTPAHSHDEAENLHTEEIASQQPGSQEDNAQAEQGIGFDYDSCLDEQPGDVWLTEDLQQADIGDDQQNDHLQHHPTDHKPASAFSAQSAHDVALRRENMRLSGLPGDPPQQAAVCQGGQAALKDRVPASDNTPAAICQAQATESGEQPGAAAGDDDGMARARRLAAAARASCDVLRGPVRYPEPDVALLVASTMAIMLQVSV